MLTQERRDAIVSMVQTAGRVDLADLGARFDVSEDTIRRDLKVLDAEGLIRRVRGGALRRAPAPRAFGGRASRDVEAKASIAEAAIQHIQPGMVLVIDGGTSTLAFGRALPATLPLTVLTNSLPLAVELGDRATIQVLMLGGRVLGASRATVGAATCRQLARVNVDMAILGACGFDPEIGLTASDAEEAEVKGTMVDRSSQALALVTQEKLGAVEPFGFARLRAEDRLLTDAPDNSPIVARCREAGMHVQCV